MTNVLFDRQSLKVVGSNRSPLPFEVEVQNVDPTGISKTISYMVPAGEPQPDIVEEIGEERLVETIENTGNPVIIKVEQKVPLLDDSGHQVEYEVMSTDEEGNQVGTGQFIKCWTTDIDEVQKRNKEGLPLWYETEIVMVEKRTPVPQEMKEETKFVTFEESPGEFTYEDILALKEKQILNGTFYGSAKLFEDMDESLFNMSLSSFKADLGLGFISLPSGGEVRTIKLSLPRSSKTVGFKMESSGPVEVSIGDLVSNLTPLNEFNEVSFDAEVSEVYVLLKNMADKRVDIQSFALLV